MNKTKRCFHEKTYKLVRWGQEKRQEMTIWNEKEDITTDPRHIKITISYYADIFEILDKMEELLESTIYQN